MYIRKQRSVVIGWLLCIMCLARRRENMHENFFAGAVFSVSACVYVRRLVILKFSSFF